MSNDVHLRRDTSFPLRADLYGALERYLNNGITPGGFLTAVLENNLSEAFGRADGDNSANLHNIIGYIYNYFPADAWGSREKVGKWLEQFYEPEAVA